MYYADVKLIHAFVVGGLSEDVQGELSHYLALLGSTEGLADGESAEFVRSFGAVFGMRNVAGAFSQLDADVEGIDVAKVLRAFYLAALAETVYNGWDSTYKVILAAGFPPQVKAAIRDLHTVDTSRLEAYLAKIDARWSPGVNVLLDTAMCLLCWRCALGGVYGPTEVYAKVCNRLRPGNAFSLVFAAGGCMKADGVLSRFHEVAEMSDEQYGCVRMLDCFFYCPGIHWG